MEAHKYSDEMKIFACDLDRPGNLARAIASFRRDGFVVIKQVLDPRELASLRAETATLIADRRVHGRDDEDCFFSAEDVFFRIQYIFARSPALLTLVAHPVLLSIARAILGDDLMVAGEALVFKAPGRGEAVPLHADCDPSHPALGRDHTYFNCDVYLDDALDPEGCLLAVPGTQTLQDPWPSIRLHGFDYPGLRPVPVSAGDLIVHDTRVIHGSRATVGKPLRRTLYYEFHRRDQLLRDGYPAGSPVTAAWADNRQRLVHAAQVQRRQTAWGSAEPVLAWQPPAPDGHGVPIDLRPRLGINKYV